MASGWSSACIAALPGRSPKIRRARLSSGTCGTKSRHLTMPLKVMPCPFCEATPELNTMQHVYPFVKCNGCAAQGPIGMNIADAVDKWNRCKTPDETLKFADAHPERMTYA